MIYGMTDDEIVEYIHSLADQISDLESKMQKATRFDLGDDVTIEKRGQDKWCVKVFETTVLDKGLHRIFEAMPSSRTPEFISSTRFTLEEAFEIATRYMKETAL